MATPQLYFQPGGIAERVMQRCDALRLPFNPTVWAPNAHSQSAIGMLRTLTARGSYTRQLVMTSDHGTLGLDWWCGADRASWAAADAPVVLFIHGINGGSHEGYVKWACMAAASRGWRPVVLNMRGCNGLPLTSGRGYNAINTADVHVAVQSIHSRFPAAPLMAAGYSLGSVLLAKYLAEADNGLYLPHATQQQQQQQDAPPPPGAAAAAAFPGDGSAHVPQLSAGSGLVAAALVSPPVCLHSTNAKMGRPTSFKFLYNLAVAYKLREYVREHLPTIQASGANIDVQHTLTGWTVSNFDDAVTLRALGYPSPHLYYRHACSTNYIPHIRTPTLILLSKDDPFLGVLPQAQVAANPFTLMAATQRGGHLAFLQGWWPLGASYCDAVIDGWLAAALQEWRHGPEAAAAMAGAAPAGSAASSGREAPQAAAIGSSPQPQPLPSWVQRGVAAKLIDPAQRFDPTTLSDVLCSCPSPFEHDAATAAPQATAAAAGSSSAAAADRGKGAATAAAAAASSRSSRAKHLWGFGFGRAASQPAGAGAPHMQGLRESGAWAPFGPADEDGDDADDGTGGSGVPGGGSRRGSWWRSSWGPGHGGVHGAEGKAASSRSAGMAAGAGLRSRL